LALILSQLVAVPIGVYSALRQDTIADYVGRIFAIFGIAVPGFWLATMVMVYPSIWWNWSPPVLYVPFAEDPLENLKTVMVPAIVLGMSMSGVTMRMSRTMMLDVLRQDYVRTAWSKGLRERLVVFRHALKNALIPVITYIGLMIPVLIGGQVVIEKIFALPGMGMLAVDALSYRDYTIVSGVNLFFAGFVLLVNLGVDLTYAWLDPRISYQTGRDAGSG
jgi:peptide/nickel transport system permease protein